MDRTEKEALVGSLNAQFKSVGVIVVTQQSGMSVAESTNLRVRVREAGASYRVTKNRLARLALEGTPYEGLKSLFTGPTAIAYSADPVAAAKVCVDFAKENEKLTIVGGGIGEQVLDAEGVKALANMPSLDQLRADLLGVLEAPASNFVGVLPAVPTELVGLINAPAQELAGVFASYGAKQAA